MSNPLSLDEICRRGDELFEREIATRIPAGDPGRVVAIDVISGDFEVDDRSLTATDGLRARHPDAQIYLRMIGWPYLHRHYHPLRPLPTNFRHPNP